MGIESSVVYSCMCLGKSGVTFVRPAPREDVIMKFIWDILILFLLAFIVNPSYYHTSLWYDYDAKNYLYKIY